MNSIQGKKAILTGAASGIGRALALELAREGTHLFLLDVNEEGLQTVATDIAKHHVLVQTQVCDLSDPRQVDHAVETLFDQWPEGPDILINNAGICYYGSSIYLPAQEWDRMLGINLLAPVQLTRRLLTALTERPEAHILNVSSMYGFMASNRSTLYHLTKFGLNGFSLALRAELARSTVGVTALCPGFVETRLFMDMPIVEKGRKPPAPPRWLCATPEQVAAKAVRAIYKNRRLVLVTPLAYLTYYFSRLAPGLLDWVYHWGAPRKKR